MVKCPNCHGSGKLFNPILWNGIGGGEIIECVFCHNTGRVSQKKRMDYVRGFKRCEND